MKWDKEIIQTEEGKQEAIAPLIISASRSTDIPAFYSDWFMNRLDKGYVKWINPFNRRPQYVSLEKTKVIVFWSKNPQPLLKYLPEIDKRRIVYYFQFTVNDYEKEGFEPNVPSIDDRIRIFKELSSRIDKKKVIWRFDPLILTNELDINELLNKIRKIGDFLHSYTEKLVISFADISAYAKVQRNLKKAGIRYNEFEKENMKEVAEGINDLNRDWDLEVSTCGEKIDLGNFGIKHNKCIDDKLIMRITDDKELMEFLGYEPPKQINISTDSQQTKKSLKDKGQRKECGCIVSKDIGQYNTCEHLCVYCYANYSPETVKRNRQRTNPNSESILPES